MTSTPSLSATPNMQDVPKDNRGHRIALGFSVGIILLSLVTGLFGVLTVGYGMFIYSIFLCLSPLAFVLPLLIFLTNLRRQDPASRRVKLFALVIMFASILGACGGSYTFLTADSLYYRLHAAEYNAAIGAIQDGHIKIVKVDSSGCNLIPLPPQYANLSRSGNVCLDPEGSAISFSTQDGILWGSYYIFDSSGASHEPDCHPIPDAQFWVSCFSN